jgi:oligopeptide transport system permease protein
MLSPFDYREQHYSHINAPMFTVCNEPGVKGTGHMHIFGTDTLGRDIFTPLLDGRPCFSYDRSCQCAG